jgi:hypothetical protein
MSFKFSNMSFMKISSLWLLLIGSVPMFAQNSNSVFGLNGNILLSNKISKIEDLANPLLSYGGGVYLNVPVKHSDNFSIGSEVNYYSRALFAESKPVTLKTASARLNFLEAYPYVRVTKIFNSGTSLSLSGGPTINYFLSGEVSLADTLGKTSNNKIEEKDFGKVVVGFQSIISVNFNPVVLQLKYNSLIFGLTDPISKNRFIQPNVQIGLLMDLRIINF